MTVIQGQASHFHTADPRYTCLNDQPLDVFEEQQEFPGDLVITGACPNNSEIQGTWTFPTLPPSPPTSAKYHGETVQLTPYSGDLPTGLLDQDIVTQFKTADPKYTCFVDTSLKVWTLPQNPVYLGDPSRRRFDGLFIVHDTCADGTTSGTWTFSLRYTYSANWDVGAQDDETNEPPETNETWPLEPYGNPVPPSSVPLLGHVESFSTDDPAYSCLNNGAFPEIYQLASNVLVVYGSCLNSVPGAWMLTLPPVPHYYKALWRGTEVDLTPYTAGLGLVQTTGELVTEFETNDPDPFITCLIGTPLNVVIPLSPDMKGKYIAYGTCLLPNGTSKFTRWTFDPSQKR